MRLLALQMWQDRICNKYTKYGIYLLLLLIVCFIFKHEVFLLLKWVFIDVIGTFITNSINDENFRVIAYPFIFGAIRCIWKKYNK